MSKARVSSGRARTCCHIRVSYGWPSIGYTTRFLIQFYLYLQHTATLSQQLLLKHLVGVYCVCILAWTVCRAVFTALTPTQDTALKGVGGKLRRGCTSRTGVSGGRSIDRYELGCRSLPDLEVLCAPTMHIVSTATQHHHHHHHHHYHHHYTATAPCCARVIPLLVVVGAEAGALNALARRLVWTLVGKGTRLADERALRWRWRSSRLEHALGLGSSTVRHVGRARRRRAARWRAERAREPGDLHSLGAILARSGVWVAVVASSLRAQS